MRLKAILGVIASMALGVVLLLPLQTSALTIASLSQTQGPTSGGNSINIAGADFILDENDSIGQLVSGSHHSIILTKGNKVYAWGYNVGGELGIGSSGGSYNSPQDITTQFGTEKIIKIFAHAYFSMAISESGKVFAWGSNSYGQLTLDSSIASRNSPQDITSSFGSETVESLTLGSYHAFAQTTSGKVLAWGWNDYGQLGTGDLVSSNVPRDITAQLNGEKIKQFQGWSWYSVVLTESGKVLTWGRNNYGQLGDGNGGASTDCESTPQDITSQFGGETIVQLEAGAHFIIALSSNSKVFAWGSGDAGQLGNGTSGTGVIATSPIDITSQFGGEVVSSLINDTGAYHSFAFTVSGKIFAWGQGGYGQLGSGDNLGTSTPKDVTANFPAISSIKQMIVGGAEHSGFLLTNTNNIYSWGRNDYGQLATGDNANRNIPENVTANFSLGTYPVIQVESIYFGSSKVEQFQVMDANTICLIVPSHAVGFVDVAINDINDRTTVLANGYEYIMINAPNTGSEYES